MQLEETFRRALRRDPAQPAIAFEGKWYGWGWMRDVAARLDAALTHAGFGARLPIGMIARNRPNFVAGLLSVIASGRGVVMIYAYQSQEALAADIGRLKLPVIVADAQDWTETTIAAARETGTMGIALAGDQVSIAVPADPAKAAGLRGPVETLAIEMLTSGTTGAPKRMPLTYEFIARALIGESTQTETLQATDGPIDPVLVAFPFGNISGLYSYVPMAAIGRPVVLLEKFNVKDWAGFVKTYKPKQMNLPPAGVRMVLDAKVPPEDLASLEYVFSGASWLDPNVQLEFLTTYKVPILLSYGATEFGGPVTAMTPDMYKQYGLSKLTSVGKAWAGTELRVTDLETGAVQPPGEAGLLELRAPRLGPDWVKTTDLAMIDVDGFMFHRGRADGAITRGGFKILPEAVAEKIALHPSVAAAAVVGLPDARLGQIPVAAVELRPGMPRPTEAELEAHARLHLYSTHVPAAFRIVDALPRTPSLKVSLPHVKALFEDETARKQAEPAPQSS